MSDKPPFMPGVVVKVGDYSYGLVTAVYKQVIDFKTSSGEYKITYTSRWFCNIGSSEMVPCDNCEVVREVQS